MHLRSIGVLIVAVLACLSIPAFSAELLAPMSGTVLSLDIAGRQSPYYQMATGTPLEFSITGPGTATAIIRLALPANFDSDSARYRVVVMEGTDTVRDVSTSTVAADAEWTGVDEQPSLLRKFSFKVPDGQHRFHITLVSTDVSYAGIRLLLKRAAAHASESPLYPVAMDRMLTLIFNEKRLDFHLATSPKPVRVRVIGPTRLRVVTRLVYGPTMKGSQKYALNLQLDHNPLKPEELSTTKAINSEFEEESEWVPGRSRTIYVVIPDGEHDLTITPQLTDAPGVALRFTLPSEDVSNEHKE